MEVVIQLLILIVGFVLLMKGADWFVDGASGIAEKFKIPQIIIGLTIVAMGTSLPEASVSIASALKGSADITVGNVLGSNIMNVLVILGITALVCAIPVKKQTLKFEIPFVLIITMLMAGLGLIDNELSRMDGAILWGFMILYLVYLFVRVKKGEKLDQEEEEEKKLPMWKMILLIPIGAAMISVGSDLAVDAATNLARLAGVGERIIGLTIIALGTSLPELVTSVAAALKKKTDIAVGNIVGSNIFNILFVAGTTALITPVAYKSDFVLDSIAATITVALLWILALPKKTLGKVAGIVMLVGYGAYFCLMIF